METKIIKATTNEALVAEKLTEQYQTAENAKNAALREIVKFGAMLLAWEQYLGTNLKRSGSGLKGWLEANCPQINYKSATVYKSLAAKSAAMLGGGAPALAALQYQEATSAPDGEVIDIAPAVIEKRDALFEQAQSRRQLEQQWFAFAAEASKGKVGRPAGSEGTYVKKTAVECAVSSVWPLVNHCLKHRGELFHAYQLLPVEKLTETRATLEEQVKAIDAELAARK